MNELKEKMNRQSTQIKMLENQVANQAASSSRPPGTLPGNPDVNPREQCKAVHLRSGFEYENPTVTRDGKPISPQSTIENEAPKVSGEVNDTDEKEPRYEPPPYKPPIPFPQRLVRANKDKQYGKFVKVRTCEQICKRICKQQTNYRCKCSNSNRTPQYVLSFAFFKKSQKFFTILFTLFSPPINHDH